MFTHIQWLLENRCKALEGKRLEERINLSSEQILDVLVSADPTDKKVWTQWLLDCWIDGGCYWEDIQSGPASKAAETLKWFKGYKSSLIKQARNIAQYKSLGKLYEAIQPSLYQSLEFLSEDQETKKISGKASKKEERKQAYGESKIILDSPEVIVSIPLTQFAAQWWGRGTRWCTAAEKDNYFDNYNKTGPLIVITIKPQGQDPVRRLQLFATGRSIQFMNENDSIVSEDDIRKYWSVLSPLVNWAIQKNSKMLDLIPQELADNSLYSNMIKGNADALEKIPKDLRSPELCKQAVEQNGFSISSVPDHLLTEDLVKLAIKTDGRSLFYVKNSMRTKDVCHLAVQQNPRALSYVPKKYITRALVSKALELDPSILPDIPTRFLKREVVLECVKKDGNIVQYIPDSMKDKEMFFAAVEQYGFCIHSIPDEYYTDEIILLALKTSPTIIATIPSNRITQEMLRKAVTMDGETLEYIPADMKSLEICKLAVAQNGVSLRFVPHQFRELEEIYQTAVDQSGSAVSYVPRKLQSLELCLKACRNDPFAINYIPREHHDILRGLIPEIFEENDRIKKEEEQPLWDLEELTGSIKSYYSLPDLDHPSSDGLISL